MCVRGTRTLKEGGGVGGLKLKLEGASPETHADDVGVGAS